MARSDLGDSGKEKREMASQAGQEENGAPKQYRTYKVFLSSFASDTKARMKSRSDFRPQKWGEIFSGFSCFYLVVRRSSTS